MDAVLRQVAAGIAAEGSKREKLFRWFASNIVGFLKQGSGRGSCSGDSESRQKIAVGVSGCEHFALAISKMTLDGLPILLEQLFL